MSGNTKRRFGAVAITGLVIVGVVGVTSMSASGEPPPAVFVPYGTLTINLTASSGSYVLKNPAGDTIQTEIIQTSQPCATVAPGSGDLLTVSPTSSSDTVQIRNSAFGVNTGNTSCGSSSAAVISDAERLTVALGPDLIDAGVSAKSAALRVTQVKKGNLRVALDDGALGSPTAVSQSPQTVPVAPAITTADDLFTSMTLASTSTKDNEGLSLFDGTTFELVQIDPNFDVAVGCGDFAEADVAPGDIAQSATYERLDNKVVGNVCQDVGVRVRIEGDPDSDPNTDDARVFWNNSFVGVNGGTEQTVQAYFTIVWKATDNLADLDRVIDYDGDGPGTAIDMQWCDGYDINGTPLLPSYSGIGKNVNGTAPWCLVNDDRALQLDGKIVQTQTLFGSGDPWAR